MLLSNYYDCYINIENRDPYGPMSGQIMSAVKDGCRKAFQAQPQRLMAAMYTCSIQANAEILGKFLNFLIYYIIDFKFIFS